MKSPESRPRAGEELGRGAACLVTFAATGKSRAALVALVPVCLGPLVVLGVSLLFRFGAAWS